MSPNKLAHIIRVWCGCLLILSIAACQAGEPSVVDPTPIPPSAKQSGEKSAAVTSSGILFDDFSYTDQQSMLNHGWIIRTESGWPGVPNAVWAKNSVSFVDDADQTGNRLLRMTSSTNGTAARQTQFCHQRKYLEGTYGARVRFTDQPVRGSDGDQIVETFYLISPLKAPLDPDYSEIDFEYLPNGGWGSDTSLHMTAWETFSPEPNWQMDNHSDTAVGSYDGWHTLVVQVGNGQVKYYVDDVLRASQGGKYYPEVPMSINFNLWFIDGGLIKAEDIREYVEDVDWVYFEGGQILSPQGVQTKVTELRQNEVKFKDTVPNQDPPLVSPCNF
ncbi:MAG TPA: glycoside hydrolase family 16 protein [Anaerolineae bacterium]|nr:glycoside hydrolase family 16 protein [Anaerolineae bacterium]